MEKKFNCKEFIHLYPYTEILIDKEAIDTTLLCEIYDDYVKYKDDYENQANFIANILRTQNSVHSVKSRVKEPLRLIEKIIRKTSDRKEKYGNDFRFNKENYKDEINDLIGIRVLHIFKEEWQAIHEFIMSTWRVIEVTANVRDGDNTKIFDDLNIEVCSRVSGYRSVHYLVELNFTQAYSTIVEIQVRTIFEEGYGEIDHKLRYSHNEIPELIKSNLLLFNRIVGSADEMASLINNLSNEWCFKEEEYKRVIEEQQEVIKKLSENNK